jgi:acyl dehydratase
VSDPHAAAAPGVVLGTRIGPFAGCLDAALIRAFADATHDPAARARAGEAAPLIALATQIWDAQNLARTRAVPAAITAAARGGVHGEHDIVAHRPVVPGEPLQTWVEAHGSRPAGHNAVVALRYVTVDTGGAVVAEQWWSTVYLGVTCAPTGEPPPPHAFPDAARERPVGEYVVDVDDDMARRYAEVSGDWSAHHFDAAAARRSGSDRPFLHGLCTMALCAQGVVQLAGNGDPDSVRRIAVRFATPMPLGAQLRVRLYDAGDQAYAFEADCEAAAVVTHGRAELREH